MALTALKNGLSTSKSDTAAASPHKGPATVKVPLLEKKAGGRLAVAESSVPAIDEAIDALRGAPERPASMGSKYIPPMAT